MIELVVSGGQTGADQAGWRAAKRYGIATAGWMPKGFKTEAGARPDFAEAYGAKSHGSASYRDRTISNIGLADATILFGDTGSPGSRLLIREATDVNHPFFSVKGPECPPPGYTFSRILRWTGIKTLNVAGNRESSSPGIGAWVEEYLCEVFRLLGHKEV